MAPPFGYQEADLWTPEELDRLFKLRTAHAELTWPEFHSVSHDALVLGHYLARSLEFLLFPFLLIFNFCE
jgi:hypothetical protein